MLANVSEKQSWWIFFDYHTLLSIEKHFLAYLQGLVYLENLATHTVCWRLQCGRFLVNLFFVAIIDF